MRNIFYAGVVFSILMSCFLVACKKNGTPNQKDESYHPIDFKAMKIGEMHNQYVIAAYSKLKPLKTGVIQNSEMLDEYRAQILEEFESIDYDPTPIGISHEDFIDRVASLSDSLSIYRYDVRNWNYNYVTQNSSNYIGMILAQCENANTLTDFNIALNNISADANLMLSGVDLDIVKGTIEIAKSSAYLWAPESQGGYDLYTKTFGNIQFGQNSSMSIRQQGLSWWKKALIGDVSASSQYFMGFGVGLAAGLATPGANGAILGGWAISAGVGSAYAAIGL